MAIDNLSEIGYELGPGGIPRKIQGGQVVRKSAIKRKRNDGEDHLSAAFNALLFGIEDPYPSSAYILEPGIKIRGQAFHVANERGSKGEAGRLKWTGVKAGVADWIFTGPPVCAIELKCGKNLPTPKQIDWGIGLEEGWNQIGLTEDDVGGSGPGLEELRLLFAPRYVICRTLADAVAILWHSSLIMEPKTFEEVGQAIERVRRYWLLRYRREIP